MLVSETIPGLKFWSANNNKNKNKI